MALRSEGRRVNHWGYYLALTLFGILMTWPIIHMIIVNNSHLSSWRLFGWGMYATPNPEQSRLRVIMRDSSVAQPANVALLHRALAKLAHDPDQESLCINLFLDNAKNGLRKMSQSGFCHDEEIARHLDYFLHFGSTMHLAQLVNKAIASQKIPSSEAIVFFTHQRFSLMEARAYIESDVYRIAGNEITSLGKFRDGGKI